MESATLNLNQRINIIGTSGCGKSTFCKKLAEKLQLPYIEIDKIFWEPGWKMPPDNVFFEKLETELDKSGWLLDGNYTRTTHIKWKNVQTVVWLDYPLYIVLTRALKRGVWRAFTKEELWEGTGNCESFKNLFSKNSMVLWTLKTFYPNRAEYNALMEDKNYSHIRFVRLSSPAEAAAFLISISNL